MLQLTSLIRAYPLLIKVRALAYVSFCTLCALVAVPQCSEGTADGSSWVNLDVRKKALVVGTIATEKVDACRHTMWAGCVR